MASYNLIKQGDTADAKDSTVTQHDKIESSGETLVTDGGTDDQPDRDIFSQKYDNTSLVHLVTQSTRYHLILDMLGHPNQAPSLDEFDYMNPKKGKSTITEHLGKLVEHGFADEIVLPKGTRKRDLPHKFYRLSDPGREFLTRHDLIPADDRVLQRQYDEVEKTDRIAKFERVSVLEARRTELNVDQEKLAQLLKAVDERPTASHQTAPNQGKLDQYGSSSQTAEPDKDTATQDNAEDPRGVLQLTKRASYSTPPQKESDVGDITDTHVRAIERKFTKLRLSIQRVLRTTEDEATFPEDSGQHTDDSDETEDDRSLKGLKAN